MTTSTELKRGQEEFDTYYVARHDYWRYIYQYRCYDGSIFTTIGAVTVDEARNERNRWLKKRGR